MKLKAATILAVICAVLAVPGTALATSPTQDAYSGVAGVQQSSNTPPAVEVGPVSTEEVESSGATLPFTGLEVGLIALVGVALLGGGVVMYRLHGRTGQQL